MKPIDLTPGFGTVVVDIDLRHPSDDEAAALRQAFCDRKLLAFPDQHLEAEELLGFARMWGDLDRQELAEQVHPSLPDVQLLEHDRERPPVGYEWHTDLSWSERPPKATVLSARVVPAVGGDTVFCDMEAVFAGLTPRIQQLLVGLTARHDRLEHLILRQIDPEEIVAFRRRHPPVDHPVVRRHAESGRPSIYVNPSFTKRINELAEDESAAVLSLLHAQIHRVVHQCRVGWDAGTVVIWDNRCLTHNAVPDYYPEHRLLERVVIAGERPVPYGSK